MSWRRRQLHVRKLSLVLSFKTKQNFCLVQTKYDKNFPSLNCKHTICRLKINIVHEINA